MSKQVKIGFDQTAAPIINTFVPLRDYLTGFPLTDSSGNILVTEEKVPVQGYIAADDSLSLLVNPATTKAGVTPITVREVFPETSAVSNSILGVPRAEVQLSLFSDVSTYGFDNNLWEFYTFNGPRQYPTEWYNRSHPIYGPRGQVDLKEQTAENALYLNSFPVQYSYPYGPKWGKNYFDDILFPQYLNFIAIGKILYKYFVDRGQEEFAEKNFINNYIKIVNSAGTEITGLSITETGIIANSGLFYDVAYGESLAISFAMIERFTLVYQNIIGQAFLFPVQNFTETSTYRGISALKDTTRPGYSNSGTYIGLLESKSTFRYQPGRISGYTLAVRSKTDTTTLDNVIEWGCANDTDQYMFQIKGPEFNIIRRSTIPLDDDLLTRMEIPLSKQVLTRSATLDNEAMLYELTIGRDYFNGDRLDASGKSGHFIKFENVTMYKIEFGWYGAIGAKFYAYVPVGNGEARWVLIHTLVIENRMGQPCLQNPDFKFRYTMSINNTKSVVEPVYIFKYGASYYIDGGDEGTLYMNSAASDIKDFSTNTSLIGLHPKQFIYNRDGVAISNRKQFYPTSIGVKSSELVKVEIKEIQGSSDGFHYHYSPSLHNGISTKSKTLRLQLDPTLSKINIVGDDIFTIADNKSKIIADGLYNTYIKFEENDVSSSDTGSSEIFRRTAYKYSDTADLSLQSITSTGSIIDLSGHTFTARLSSYNTIVASTIPITSEKFKIHFLNPGARDKQYNKHFAEFAICITDKKPEMVSIDGVDQLRFNVGTTETGTEINIFEESAVEWSQLEEARNQSGVESTEWDPTYGVLMDIDPRIPNPLGVDSGSMSVLIGDITYDSSTFEFTEDLGNGRYNLVYAIGTAPSVTEKDIDVLEFGVNKQGIGLILKSLVVPKTFRIDGNNVPKVVIEVEGDIDLIGNDNTIQIKKLKLTDGFALTSYTADGDKRFSFKDILVEKKLNFTNNPCYLVVGLRDYARVNGVVVEEINPDATYTHNPNWITSSTSVDANGNPVDIIVNSGGSSSLLSPANLVPINRSSSITVDNQLLQPLRPGVTIHSFYVEANDTSLIDLDNIFGRDRKSITTGLYNNKICVITGNKVGGGPAGTIEVSLSFKEQ